MEQFLKLSYYCDISDAQVPFDLPENIFDVKQRIQDWLSTARRGVHGTVDPRAEIDGVVIVEEGATVGAGAVIEGPALVTHGAVVGRSYVRDNTVIGPGTRVGYACEITRTLVLAQSRAVHHVVVGDSVIGNNVNIGASSVISALKVDRPVEEPAVEEITVTISGRKLGTGQTKFGAVLGDRVQLPALTSVAPGTLIGSDVTIFPTDQLGGLYPSDARVRS